MAMKSHHSRFIIKSNYPDTYFVLLPDELLSMLDSYYYGPLEIKLLNYKDYRDFEHLRITHFDSNNQIDSSIMIIMPVAKLIKDYMKNHNEGDILNSPSEVVWSEKRIKLICTCAIVNLNGEFIR